MNKKIKEGLLKLWIYLSFLFVVAVVVFILGYIFNYGIGSINKEFLLHSPRGMPIGSEGGIFPAIIGSILLTLIACFYASIMAIATSIYLKFYCKRQWISNMIHLMIQCTAGIPSIILGLFGYTFLVYRLDMGMSLLAGGITLGIMIFPYTQVRIEKIIGEVDQQVLEASFALGITKSYTFFHIILPLYKRNILSAITLGGGFAMGAAAPIILTAAVFFAPIPNSLFSPVMALPFHLYILMGEGISLDMAYGTAFVLIVLVILLNMISLVTIPFKRRK